MIEKPKSFVPVMLTPFKENGEIDFDSLTALTEYYLSAGATGLFANCQSSEMFVLSGEERIAITDHVIKVANGAVPVVATGTFGRDINEHADFVKRIYDLGVEAVILITSLLAQKDESDDILEDHVFQLIHKTPNIPLGFYECPEPYKRVLSAKQLGAFVDTGRVIYHKDTCLDIEKVREKIRVTSKHPSFGLYDAYMAHAVESLRSGSTGLSCIQGNYFPELIVWLCNNYDNAALSEHVSSVQQFFIDQMDVMHASYPLVAKYFLKKRGIIKSEFSRIAVDKFDSEVQADLDELYEKSIRLMNEIDLEPVL
jgi:4-hydroxy-tetrahydrodipicolinate synthase